MESNSFSTIGVPVSLSGSGVECDIAVSPSVVDFGTLTVGSSSAESVTITNQLSVGETQRYYRLTTPLQP